MTDCEDADYLNLEAGPPPNGSGRDAPKFTRLKTMPPGFGKWNRRLGPCRTFTLNSPPRTLKWLHLLRRPEDNLVQLLSTANRPMKPANIAVRTTSESRVSRQPFHLPPRIASSSSTIRTPC